MSRKNGLTAPGIRWFRNNRHRLSVPRFARGRKAKGISGGLCLWLSGEGLLCMLKKGLSIAGRVLTVLLLVFAVFVMVFTVISVNTVGKADADFLGFKPNIVLSDSMQDTFAVGDLEISKKVDPATLAAGDIITFRSIDPANYGSVVTHKIREGTTYEGGLAFVTYGTTTGVDDAHPVPADRVLGKYVFRLPKMGYFFEFLTTPAGYVTLILLPFLVLIGLRAVRFVRLARQYRAEQREEAAAQQAQLEEEQRKNQEMREELDRLRAQLSGEAPDSRAEAPGTDEDAGGEP